MKERACVLRKIPRLQPPQQPFLNLVIAATSETKNIVTSIFVRMIPICVVPGNRIPMGMVNVAAHLHLLPRSATSIRKMNAASIVVPTVICRANGILMVACSAKESAVADIWAAMSKQVRISVPRPHAKMVQPHVIGVQWKTTRTVVLAVARHLSQKSIATTSSRRMPAVGILVETAMPNVDGCLLQINYLGFRGTVSLKRESVDVLGWNYFRAGKRRSG